VHLTKNLKINKEHLKNKIKTAKRQLKDFKNQPKEAS
jgi:hypothetical protein